MSEENRANPRPRADVMKAIGGELRRVYAEIVAEGTGTFCRDRAQAGRGKQQEGEPMTLVLCKQSAGLSAEQRHALAVLADAGRNGVTAAIMLANGFKTRCSPTSTAKGSLRQ